MEVMLNKDILAGRWEQVKGRVRQRWGRLSDKQLDQISGHYDELTRLVRERYGYTWEKARREVDEFIERLGLLERQP
ncbi:MAG TPA: hypothetical protein VI524_01805 [Anaerolineales bacterium]|nr:hypothetical protein [Anaerolineales bacterium]